MSATVTNDSFLVKGLRILPKTIRTPLVYEKEKWSGERMILIPELIHSNLTRSDVINNYAPNQPRRPYGVVALTPSKAIAEQWVQQGAVLPTTEKINQQISDLRGGYYAPLLVIANRYDGIDLPDDACRILIIDSKPHSDNLADRLADNCRADSVTISLRTARAIEQGIGRSVRGEKDYCVVFLTGHDLVECVRSKSARQYLSPQTQLQIQIGLEIIEFAKDELSKGNEPFAIVQGLVAQCVKRDAGWKEYYVNKMDGLDVSTETLSVLEIFQAELDAEVAFQSGQWLEAKKILQNLLDSQIYESSEKGWYLQEIARYTEPHDKINANKLQISAHLHNRYLLRPKEGMQVSKLKVNQERSLNIIAWVMQFDSYDNLNIGLNEILDRLCFGIAAERFESAFHKLGCCLGFACERPDKEWKEGPDNLWALEKNKYLLIECKNEVKSDRLEINKEESGQMNNSVAWFKRNYPGAESHNLMIIPTNRLNKAAGFVDPVEIMRMKELGQLTRRVRAFFKSFHDQNLQSLDASFIQSQLESHQLTIDNLVKDFSKAAIAPI